LTTDDVSGHFVADNWVLTVIGTTETENEFCDFSGLSLANTMTTGRDYQVQDYGTVVEPKDIWISTTLEGKEAIDKKCADLIYMTIDIKLPSGRWMTLADESKGQIVNATHGEEHMNEAVYFKTNDEGELYMVAQISQEEFVEGAQTMFNTLDDELTIEVRSAWRVDENEPISGMTNEWNFKVRGSGEPSPCEEALISKESQTQDFILSFGDVANIEPWMIPPQRVTIERAIETTSTTKACGDKAKYVLQMWDKLTNGGEYVDFEDLKATLKTEVTHHFNSYIHFENGNFDSEWFY
jgi:hypothetical protein